MSFLKEMLSGANDKWSSKRIVGTFCVLASSITIIILAFIDPSFPSINSLLEWVLITGAALLGVGVAERRFRNKVDNDEYNEGREK